MNVIFSLAFAISLFFSPDFLTIFGNGLGNGGIYFLGLLILVFVFHAFTANSYGAIYSSNPDLDNEYVFIRKSLGNITGFIFPFLFKATMVICLGVGLLAAAGYAFNELFVRWFPNMGFTLLLLGILLVIGLTGPKVIRICQLIFSGVSILAVITLSIIGIFFSVDSSPILENINLFQIKEISPILLCFVLLMGFEMAGTFRENISEERDSLKRITMISLVCGVVVLILWGIATLMTVAPERLSDTYIPHLIAARAINGVYGREIMGLVIIFGTLGAVNALLAYLSSIAREVLSKELPFKIDKRKYGIFSFIILVLTIAGLLISGMAGEPEFETFTRGSIYFWLLSYGAIHLAMFVLNGKKREEGIKIIAIKRYVNLIASLLICSIYCGLVLTDHESMLILKFTGTIACGALLLYLFFRSIIVKFNK